VKFSRWTGVVRKWLRLKPPVWETPQWDEMSWEEKMALWRKHRKINIVLSCIYVACFLGSFLWVVKTGRDAKLLGLLNLIMLACILAAMFLMD
jgi:predicted acyltransferase